ncbi:MAG: hypothetical protein FWH08_01840 [Oscillospiraceae bacterium]|nr:hypothetical protein [Oscillospiraceae bacterium]
MKAKKFFAILMALAMIFTFTVQSAAAMRTLNGVTYSVNSDGSLGEKYTGWATSSSSGARFYFEDGERVTGVQVIGGTRHVFDEKGVWLLGRTNAKEDFSVIVDNDYTIDLKDGRIYFDVKVNNAYGKSGENFTSGEHFSLFMYKDSKWVRIPYVSDYAFTEMAMYAGEDMTLSYSKRLSSFDHDFEPGIYRVLIRVGGTDVRGEFNAVGTPPKPETPKPPVANPEEAVSNSAMR